MGSTINSQDLGSLKHSNWNEVITFYLLIKNGYITMVNDQANWWLFDQN